MEQAARVLRLKVPSHQGSLAPVRHQVSQWLEAQTPARLGLPAHAIVLLKRVRAPWSALRPGSHEDVLAPSLRGAVRPATGMLPGAGCEAIWFDGEAELLACLARDSLQGQVGQRWWWQTWLGRRASDDDARQAWVRSARLVPQAMGCLSDWGQSQDWARAFGASGRLALLQAMLAHHAVTPSAMAPLSEALLNDRPRTAAVDRTKHHDLHAHGRSESTVPVGEPTAHLHDANWWPVLDCDGAAVLTALCQVLREAPFDALQAHTLPTRLMQAMPAAGKPSQQQESANAWEAAQTADANDTGHPALTSSQPPRRPGPATTPSSADSPSPRFTFHPTTEEPRAGAPSSVNAPALTHATNASNETPTEPHAPWPSARQAASLRPQPMRRPGAGGTFDTAHGGTFFLLNVALAWELYGDFTRPQHTLLSVSPWQFLHAAGLALLGRDFARDPIAPWLRAQARFERPRPASALGAAALDLIPPGEAQPLRAPPVRPVRPARPSASELGCWWPLLRQRLALALELPAPDAALACLSLPARVTRQGDRVDVHCRLAQLPLSVRLAGLDRNPGWVPASGCDFRFHFEA